MNLLIQCKLVSQIEVSQSTEVKLRYVKQNILCIPKIEFAMSELWGFQILLWIQFVYAVNLNSYEIKSIYSSGRYSSNRDFWGGM